MVLVRRGLFGVSGLVLGAGVLSGVAFADWPQFLGPSRNAVADKSSKLPRSWPTEGPRVLWRIPVGEGFGGPAIFGDSVLLLDREADTRDVLRRLRLSDGQEIWRYPYDAPGKLSPNGSRTTPATDGRNVYCTGPFGDISAVAFKDGSLIWGAHLLKDWGSSLPGWGVAQSPLLDRDSVIVAPWGKAAAVVALNKATGKVKWTTPNPDGIQLDYSSPVPTTIAKVPMIVVSGKAGYTIGVDPATGKQLWSYKGYSVRISISSPVAVGEGRILMTGGYDAGSAMFQVQKTQDMFSVIELWKNNKGVMGSKIGQPIVYNGSIYGNSSDDGGGLRCITFDGKVNWQTGGNPGFEMGQLVLADGLIFILNGSNGELAMVEADPSQYKELGRAQILQGKTVWAPLAYSGGKLIIRDQRQLACIDLSGSRA